MKLIKVYKWEDSHKAVALVYAEQASDLATELNGLTLTAGSKGYIYNGENYVLGANGWTKVEGGGSAAPVIAPLTINENGTYEAPEGVDGYSPVTANVPTSELTPAEGESF